MLKSTWRSTGFNIHTKIRIFNSNVLSVLLYGSECLKTSVASERKLEVFQTKYLRRISSRYTGQTSSRTKSCSIGLGYLGYRRPSKKDAGAGLVMSSAFLTTHCPGWLFVANPWENGTETWRQTVLKDLKIRGLTMETAPRVSTDRARWRSLGVALSCSRR